MDTLLRATPSHYIIEDHLIIYYRIYRYYFKANQQTQNIVKVLRHYLAQKMEAVAGTFREFTPDEVELIVQSPPIEPQPQLQFSEETQEESDYIRRTQQQG